VDRGDGVGNSGRVEIAFSVTQEADGGFVAECLSHDIFTQGDSWETLRANVPEVARLLFRPTQTHGDPATPPAVRTAPPGKACGQSLQGGSIQPWRSVVLNTAW